MVDARKIQEIVAKNIIECREKKGLSAKEVSKRIHLAEKYYKEEVEKTGKGLDSISRIIEIAEILDVSPYELLKNVIEIEKQPGICEDDVISYIREQPRENLKKLLNLIVGSL